MRPRIIGHRGAAGLAPENTLIAIRRALELGVDGIEIDVHLSRDMVPVVMHDATTLRTCGVEKRVADTDWEELSTLDAGHLFAPGFQGEKIPTLDQVLALLEARHTLLLEIKEGRSEDWVPALRPRLVAATAACKIIVMGFDQALMLKIKAALPSATVLHLLSENDTFPADHVEFDGYGVCRSLALQTDHIAALKFAGKILSVWTVNDPTELSRWSDADYITTDRPDLFVSPKES